MMIQILINKAIQIDNMTLYIYRLEKVVEILNPVAIPDFLLTALL